MTEVSVETCLINLKVLSFSLKYFILNFNFGFKPLDFRRGLTSSAVPQEQFSNNYEVI